MWSFRGNACDVPDRLPQRERSGFSGDWQVYVATAAPHDVAGFSDKWLRDLAADQWPDGRIPVISPNPAGAGPAGSPFADAMEGSAGWGDAAVFVPWELWRAYGDVRILERQYPSMTRWVDYAAARAREHRHPDRAGAAAPHERYLWDTGGHFGEWLEPGEILRPRPHRRPRHRRHRLPRPLRRAAVAHRGRARSRAPTPTATPGSPPRPGRVAARVT